MKIGTDFLLPYTFCLLHTFTTNPNFMCAIICNTIKLINWQFDWHTILNKCAILSNFTQRSQTSDSQIFNDHNVLLVEICCCRISNSVNLYWNQIYPKICIFRVFFYCVIFLVQYLIERIVFTVWIYYWKIIIKCFFINVVDIKYGCLVQVPCYLIITFFY